MAAAESHPGLMLQAPYWKILAVKCCMASNPVGECWKGGVKAVSSGVPSREWGCHMSNFNTEACWRVRAKLVSRPRTAIVPSHVSQECPGLQP